MTTDLISKALMKAYNLRQPARGLVFHSDRGSQYTSKQFGRMLSSYGIRAMVFEPVWVMWVRVGIMPLLSVSLVV